MFPLDSIPSAFCAPVAFAIHYAAEQCLIWKLGIGGRHGIPAQAKTVLSDTAKKTVEEEPAFLHGEHDFTGASVLERASCNLDLIARPEGWQHALPVHLQVQAAADPQAGDGQRHACLFASQRRVIDCAGQSQDVFRDELHMAEVPATLPQARAAVSNTRSERKAGF